MQSKSKSIDSFKSSISTFIKEDFKLDKRTLINATLSSVSLSLFYIGLMLFFSHGRLFFGGDNAGFYNVYDFTLDPTTASFFYFIGNVLGGFNFYAGDYIALFLIMFMILFLFYNLTRLIVFDALSPRNTRIASVISSFFYVVGPSSITEARYSFAGNIVSPHLIFTVLFFIGTVMVIRSDRRALLGMVPSLILMGVGFALSLPKFPNNIRIAVIQTLIFVMIYLSSALVRKLRFPKERGWSWAAAKKFAASIISISIFSFYSFLPVFRNLSFYMGVADSGASANAYLGFYTGEFNTIHNSLRLFGNWLFPYTSYHVLYIGSNPIALASYLWPFLFIVSFAVVFKNRKNLVLPSLLLPAVIMFFWYKGGNPPLGSLWWDINSFPPQGYQFIPPNSFSFYIELIYYPFVAFAVVFISGWGARRIKSFKRRGYMKFSVIAVIVALLSFSMLPIFTGEAETQPYNSSINTTFHVPAGYSSARSYLIPKNGPVLLLPQTGTYLSTAWNYTGSASFYQLYFSPVKLINQFNYGGDYISSANKNVYFNITHPVVNVNNTIEVSSNWANLMIKNNVSYILVDEYINEPSSSETYVHTAIHFLSDHNVTQEVKSYKELTLYKVNSAALEKFV